jgi:nitrile hydratase alpha subunit
MSGPDSHDHGHSHDDGHHHDHHHDHDHHDAIEHGSERESDPEVRILDQALRELLYEKGIITPEEIQRTIESLEALGEGVNGKKIIARAWVDQEFRKLLLADGRAALLSLGLDLKGPEFIVVENTPVIHNVIVCTLCSCYPRAVLGLPPSWYKSNEYRSRVVREPREVLREFGTDISDDIEIRVHDSLADLRFMVLPMRPANTDGWSEAQLAELVSRDAMIGVRTVANPS